MSLRAQRSNPLSRRGLLRCARNDIYITSISKTNFDTIIRALKRPFGTAEMELENIPQCSLYLRGSIIPYSLPNATKDTMECSIVSFVALGFTFSFLHPP